MSTKPRRVKAPERQPDPAGPTVRTTATVAPGTVQALGQAPARPRRRPQPLGRPRTGQVRHERVAPLAWETAQALLASGSYTRVEVVSTTEVVVR